MPVLRSFVNGRWTAPQDGQPVRDAVTGEEVARVSSAGSTWAPRSTTDVTSAARPFVR